jgi:hypothetical protein
MNPLTPTGHEIELGGVKYALRFKILDWRIAEKVTGEKLWPIGGTPFWQHATDDQLQTMIVLLFVGIRRLLPRETKHDFDAFQEWANEVIGEENFKAANETIGAALTDFFRRLGKAVGKEAEIVQSLTETTETSGTTSGASPESISGSPI